MKFLMFLFAWCFLLAMSWPIALFALFLLPLVWLVLLPFRLLAVVVRATFACVEALLFLPARLLGYRPSH
ncbi:MAG TPA: hypothetical protein VF277_00595 [Steroidobacteraceae bacterium]